MDNFHSFIIIILFLVGTNTHTHREMSNALALKILRIRWFANNISRICKSVPIRHDDGPTNQQQCKALMIYVNVRTKREREKGRI
jgi:hypothetical protein